MVVHKNRNRSGSISNQVVQKNRRSNSVIKPVGIAKIKNWLHSLSSVQLFVSYSKAFEPAKQTLEGIVNIIRESDY